MAASQTKDELAALEQARSRLEAALADDENWRALRQPGSDIDAMSEERRARDTRLEMALADNPLYQAWRHLNEAIAALRAATAAAGEPASDLAPSEAGEPVEGAEPSEAAEPVEATEPAETTEPSAVIEAPQAPNLPEGPADLPEEIARLLRAGVPDDAARGNASDAPAEAAEPEPEGPNGAAHVLPARDEPAIAPAGAEPAEDQSPPPEPTSANVAEGAAKPAEAAETDGGPLLDGGRVAGEPEEATVSFVRRQPRQPLLPSAQLPADLGTERKSKLFERLRSLTDEPEQPEAPASPTLPKGEAEEAEVVIVTAEAAQEQRDGEARAGRLRRFRKALSGD